MKKKLVILGAGPAGLTAAYYLLKKSNIYDVTIIECDKQVGGISKTITYSGNKMDLGGHRFFSKDKQVNDIWKSIMPIQGSNSYDDKVLKNKKELENGGPNPEKEDNTLLIRNRVSRIYYLKKFFDYPISLSIKTINSLGFITTIKSGFSYIKSVFFKKKETNLENFYINRFGKKLYSMFFKEYTEKLWGRSPSEISASWGSQRVKGISIKEVLKNAVFKLFNIKKRSKETSLIESFYYPKYGPGQLWDLMSKEIKGMGGEIILNSRASSITKINKKIVKITYTNKDKEYSINPDIVISSIPLKDLVNISNDIPKNIRSIATNLPYRDFMTLGVVLKKINLENKTKIKTLGNIIPDCWIYVQEKNVKMGRIQVFNNWSPYLVKDVNNTVSLGLEYFCSEGDSLWNMSDKKFMKFAVGELESMGITSLKSVVDYHVERVEKAYPAYFDSYKDIDILINYLNKINNLYCIGRNGQHHYNNMDHSMLSAIEAIDNILENKRDKSNIWNVNTENTYHEEDNND